VCIFRVSLRQLRLLLDLPAKHHRQVTLKQVRPDTDPTIPKAIINKATTNIGALTGPGLGAIIAPNGAISPTNSLEALPIQTECKMVVNKLRLISGLR